MRLALALVGLALAATACKPGYPFGVDLPPIGGVNPCAPHEICVNGAVRYIRLEGGFWAIRGDDSVTYDPIRGMPDSLRTEGLRVHLRALERQDVVSFHMVGTLVQIIEIKRL